jgi:hypothetical protein
MNRTKTTTKHADATTDVDPARLAHLKMLERQRQLARRALLKRRRKKSGQ